MEVLGIDIGGSGMKGALVNVITGERTTKKFRINTPKSRKPKERAKVIKEIVEHFNKTNRSGKVHQIIEIMTASTNQNDKLVCTATYRLVIRGE